jgi:glucose-1-phosphate cytidylyltransferase
LVASLPFIPINFHLVEFDERGVVQRIRSSQQSDIWINGGYFIFRKEIFDYLKDGEELVLGPFNRLIETGDLMAYRYEGFWRAMDTLRDRRVLVEMVEQGETPWMNMNNGDGSEISTTCGSWRSVVGSLPGRAF